MKIIIRTKLLGEHIELRDNQMFKQDIKVILCKSKNYKDCYHLGEEYQIITLAQQKKMKVVNTQRSMFPPYKHYRIYSTKWKPKGKQETEIMKNGRPEYTKDSKGRVFARI